MSQSRSRSKLQASQKASPVPHSEKEEGDPPAAKLFRLFHMPFRVLLVSLACQVVYVPVPFARGRCCARDKYLLSIHHPGWRASHGSDRGHPWPGECSPLQSWPSAPPSLSTALAAAHSWPFFVFFPCFSHNSSHPLLLLFIGALAFRL